MQFLESSFKAMLVCPASCMRDLRFLSLERGSFEDWCWCSLIWGRKQEELVQQVRKRLEEALMADMLAHVEEIARDGEAPSEKEGGEEEGEEEEEEEEQDHDQEMENV